MVILTGIAELFGTEVPIPAAVHDIAAGAPLVFALLILGCSALLLGFNAALRRAIIPPAQPQPVVDA